MKIKANLKRGNAFADVFLIALLLVVGYLIISYLMIETGIYTALVGVYDFNSLAGWNLSFIMYVIIPYGLFMAAVMVYYIRAGKKALIKKYVSIK